MRSKAKILVHIFVLLIAALLVYLAALHGGARRNVPLEELLVEEAELSSAWETGAQQKSDSEWQLLSQSDDDVVPGGAAFSYATEAQSRSWDIADGPIINEAVFRYRTPVLAAMQFWIARPELFYLDELPNFSAGSSDTDRYPSNWKYQPAADQELVVCGMGNPSRCSLWYYHVRYGQYVVSVSFFAPNEGISAEDFQRITDRVNARLRQKLD